MKSEIRERGPKGLCDACFFGPQKTVRLADYLATAVRLRPIDGVLVRVGAWLCEEHLDAPGFRTILNDLDPQNFPIAGDAGRGDRQLTAGDERVTNANGDHDLRFL